MALGLVSYFRIFFGGDFADESGFVAIPYTFLKGARPFIDEIAITQNVGVLLIPFFKIYLSMAPSAIGLILAARHLYFILCLFAVFKIFEFGKEYLKRDHALLIALGPLAFIFFSVPTLYYNTLAELGLLIGVFSFLSLLVAQKRPVLNAFVGTFFLGAASYGYPPFLIIGVPLVLFTFARINQRVPVSLRKRTYISCLLTAAFWVLVAVGSLTSAGLSYIPQAIKYYEIFGSNFGGVDKLQWFIDSVQAQSLYLIPILLGLFAIFLSLSRIKWAPVVSVLIAVLLLAMAVQSPNSALTSINTIFFMGALPITLLTQEAWAKNRDTRFFFILSILSAIVFAWTSSNGYPNSSLGLITTATLNLMAISTFAERVSFFPSGLSILKLFLMGYMSFILCFCFRFVYSGNGIENQDTLITEGAYAGIWTSDYRRGFTDQMEHDLSALRAQASSIVFFNDFPAGYLMTDLQRQSMGVWIVSPESIHANFLEARAKFALDYYRSQERLPDLAVYMKRPELGESAGRRPDPVFDFFSRPPYRLIFERLQYQIYKNACPDRKMKDLEFERGMPCF
jgi:hypothetical protein